jgi:prepilin-type processing-associated H-X9-DG protein
MNATRTKCGAQLRGWGQAVTTYMQEYDGWFGAKPAGGYCGSQWDQDPAAYGIGPPNPAQIFPSGTYTDPENPGANQAVGPGIYASQGNHMLSAKTRFCPADNGQIQGRSGVFYYGNRPLPSYRFAAYISPPGGPPRLTIVKVSRFTDLANRMMMCDAATANNYSDLVSCIRHDGNQSIFVSLQNSGAGVPSPRNFNGTGWDTQKELNDRHGGKGNVLFLDSHVDCVGWNDYVANIPAADNLPPNVDLEKKWTRVQEY